MLFNGITNYDCAECGEVFPLKQKHYKFNSLHIGTSAYICSSECRNKFMGQITCDDDGLPPLEEGVDFNIETY